MGWPQITMIVLVASGLTLAAKDHKKPRANENFWLNLLGKAILIVLLYFGGFWG